MAARRWRAFPGAGSFVQTKEIDMRKLGALIVAAALAGTAWAQTSDQAGRSGQGGSASGVATVSGGVGSAARDNMRTQAPPHNVKMVFSLNTGNYLSDVDVKVTDGSGKTIVSEVSNGPWLYAQLPAGNYTATATYGGKAVTQRFSVGKSGVKTAHFRWPASVEQTAVGASGGDSSEQILGTGPQELR
jgi:hypothetical protein